MGGDDEDDDDTADDTDEDAARTAPPAAPIPRVGRAEGPRAPAAKPARGAPGAKAPGSAAARRASAASTPGATTTREAPAASTPGSAAARRASAASTPGATTARGAAATSTPGATATRGTSATSTPGATTARGAAATSTPGATATRGAAATSTPGATTARGAAATSTPGATATRAGVPATTGGASGEGGEADLADEAAPRFAVGTVLARRYRLVRLLGPGARGERYEAEDLARTERVLLETLGEGIDVEALARLRAAVQRARRVSHPSVGRLFDVGVTAGEPGAGAAPVTFVTMELLEGQTLGALLAEAGALPVEVALPLVRQLAAGLAAAHAAGVHHHDLQPDDVLLLERPGAPPRVVVTRFGIAAALATAAGDAAEGGGELPDPPDYLAPEQVVGAMADETADVFALGVVLYVMVSGELPFRGATPWETAALRVELPAPSVAAVAPGLDRRWVRAIARCLEREPERRFAGPLDVLAALESEPDAVPGDLARPAGGADRRIASRHDTADDGAEDVDDEDDDHDDDHHHRIRGDADGSPADDDRADAERARGEQAEGGPGGHPPGAVDDHRDPDARARRSGRGAAPALDGDDPRRHALAAFAASRAGRATGRAGFAARVAHHAERLAQAVGLGRRARAAAAALLAAVAGAGVVLALVHVLSRPDPLAAFGDAAPSSAEGRRRLVAALAAERRLDPVAASRELAAGVSDEPDSPALHAALAEALALAGTPVAAHEAGARAAGVARAHALDARARLAVDVRLAVADGDWRRAAGLAEALAKLWPGDGDVGLLLAAAQVRAGAAREALATVEALRRAGDDARIDLVEAAAAAALGDGRRELAAAEHALARSDERAAPLVVARAQLAVARARATLAPVDVALAAAAECRRLAAAAGDRALEAGALEAAGAAHAAAGAGAEAKADLQRALALRVGLGDRAGEAAVRSRLGHLALDAGDFDAAIAAFGEVLSIARPTGDARAAATALGDLGGACERRGDLSRARDTYQAALAADRALGDEAQATRMTSRLARTVLAAARLDESVALWEQALAAARRSGVASEQADALAGLGTVARLRDDLPAARARFADVLALRDKGGDTRAAWRTRLALAELALDGGDVEGAEEAAEKAARAFDADHATSDAALGWELVARARLGAAAPSAVAAAEVALGRAERSMSGSAAGWETRLRVDATAARLEMARGAETRGDDGGARLATAEARLSAVIDAAARAGELPLAAEIALARAESLASAGRRDDARAAARALETDATSRGLLLVAHRAAALAARLR